MDAELRRALAEIAGAKGTTDAGVVSPADAEQVSAVLRRCAERGARVAVVSGPPAGRGGPPEGAAVLLSLARLAAVAVDAPAAVVRAEAGVPVSSLRTACKQAGTALVATVATPSPAPTHVGSLVARGGLPRRAICGIEAVLGTGERVRAGGAVQRDVTGYDLVAALLGSSGRLAVITAVWFRLQPAGAPPGPHDALGVVEPGVLGDTLRAAFDPAGVLSGS
jgi:FAD/FMN-containing dehydrogenase